MTRKLRTSLPVMITTVLLTSCADKERTLTVACEQIRDDNTVIHLNIEDATRTRVGILGTRALVPGTLVELIPTGSATFKGANSASYVLHVSDTDFLPTKLYGWLWGEVVRGPFHTNPDIRLEQLARAASVDINEEIVEHTDFTATGMTKDIRRFDLRDPIKIINSNAEAVSMMRENSQRRFLMISGVAYGKHLFFIYAGDKLEGLSSTHLHLNYRCPPETLLNTRGESLPEDIALILFYVPVVYDASSKRVQQDVRPVDFKQFTLAPGV